MRVIKQNSNQQKNNNKTKCNKNETKWPIDYIKIV